MITVMMRHLARRIVRNPGAVLRVMMLLLAVLTYGTTGFLYFELQENPDLTWSDGAWYSIVTVTTVGYGDFFPKTPGGRFLVAMPLMFFGIGLLGYVLSVAASLLVQAKTKELRGMSSYKLDKHLVIFNFPGVAKVERLLDELMSDPAFGKREVVLIDDELPENVPELVARDVLYVRGNPTRDETLTRASLDTATYAVVLSKHGGDRHSDDQNVAITLAIEARNPNVYTVVECVDYTTQELLRKAGCDRIVCTSRFEAHFLSHELLNPGVQEVVEELISNLQGQQIYVAEFSGKKGTFSDLVKRCRERGHLLIGVQNGEAAAQLNPSPDVQVAPGDRLITIGQQRLDLS